MNIKEILLLVSLAIVFIIIYVVRVEKHCPAHPFAVEANINALDG
jgi:hypothetical protein